MKLKMTKYVLKIHHLESIENINELLKEFDEMMELPGEVT
jgi:hypothetical protein